MAGSETGVVAIVDDDSAVRDSLKFVLEVSGHNVVTYASAAEFLGNRDTHPACLILDQHMPQMTGLELTARLRREGETLPVLLITASPSPDIAAQAAQLGVEKVLEKPPREHELLGFVERHN